MRILFFPSRSSVLNRQLAVPLAIRMAERPTFTCHQIDFGVGETGRAFKSDANLSGRRDRLLRRQDLQLRGSGFVGVGNTGTGASAAKPARAAPPMNLKYPPARIVSPLVARLATLLSDATSVGRSAPLLASNAASPEPVLPPRR